MVASTLFSKIAKFTTAEKTSTTGQTFDVSTLTEKTYLVIGTYTDGGAVYFGILSKRSNNYGAIQQIFIRNGFLTVTQSGTTITFTAASGYGATYFDFIPLC